MADTLESLEIKVQHSASGADAEINGVASAISNLKSAINGVPASLKELAAAVKACKDAFKGGFTNFNKLGDALANIAVGSNELGSSSNDVMTLANAMNALAGVKITAGSFNALASGVEKVGVAAQAVTPEAIENLDKMVTSLAKLQGVDLSGLGSALNSVRRVGNIKPTEAPMPVPVNIQEMIMAANQIDILEAKLESLRVALQEAFAAGDMDKAYSLRGQILQTEAALEKARASAKGAAEGVKELSKEASKSKGPLENFVDSLKRIAFYRFIRTIIKAITQAFQEGLQNAYAFSQGISSEGHRFSVALDSMSSAGLKMKNQLGSAFIGLLAAIAPIVNAIISLITRVADALSQIFAIFTGGTYLKAADVPAKWADSAGGAAKAAKEWKNQLLGFDEINRLEEPSDPSGGGGGAGALDPSAMFVDTPISGIFAKIRDELLEFRDSLDFEPLKRAWGELVDVAGRFADMVERRVGYVWETYLKPLAKWTIEKGLPLLIEDLAKAFGLVLDVLEDLNPLINEFEETVIVPIMNWDLARVEDGLKALGEIIDKIDGLDNGDISFDEFFNGLGDNLLKLTDWLNPVQAAFREIGEWLGTKLKVLLDGMKQQLEFSKQDWETYTESLKERFNEIKEKAETTWEDIKTKASTKWEEIKTAISNQWEGIKTSLQKTWNELTGWIYGAWDKLKTWWEQRSLPSWHISLPHISVDWQEAGDLAKFFGFSRVPSLRVDWFANGGFPDEGSLYFAGERGPELVGSMGNRNAVANNDQIVEGIRQGVYDAVSAAMANNGTSEPVVRVYLDSREIKNGQNRLNRAMGVG